MKQGKPLEPADFVTNCRQHYPKLPPDLLKMVAFAADNNTDEEQAKFREQVCEELNETLLPADRSLIRYLLEQEILAHRQDSAGVNDNLKFCAYLLYRLKNIEDTLLIWQAKNITFDTFCGLDVQLITGAGYDNTIHYLKTVSAESAQKAVEYLEQCFAAGDFTNPEGYQAAMAYYFRKNV